MERENKMETMLSKFVHSDIGVGENGHMTFAGADVISLAEKYGTPLMLLDEERIRSRMREYIEVCARELGGSSGPLYASKALSFKGIFRIAAEEGMRIDCVSPGEVAVAKAAGFPMERAYFHGSCKTDDDLCFALDAGVGHIVVDSKEEAEALSALCVGRGTVQKILLRVTPGIDPHTHEKISTGKVDSKFGTPIETGQAEKLIEYILTLPGIELRGYHCHVGSQVFSPEPFMDAAHVMISFSAHIKKTLGFEAPTVNLGGGIGVRYVEEDPTPDRAAIVTDLAAHVRAECAAAGIAVPEILIEPGRSIVADSGMTVYTVGSVKDIPGYKSYVSIDGGMTDNPRYALYQSQYSIYNADRPNDEADYVCTIAGRCCESGDLIAEGVKIARPVRGEHIAVAVTGAYNYSMASNYNRIPRPAVVFISDGSDRLAIRRESYEDMMQNEQ